MTTEPAPPGRQEGSHAGPKLGWYGDDFTGATDTLATLAHARWRALLFLGVPTPAQLQAVGPLDAVGIAGGARAMDPHDMRTELEPVGRFFADQRVAVLHYKVCSTFDSAPDTGNIGTAIRTLRRHVANPFVPIVGGQPNIGRYCLFSHLYAAAGMGGSVHRIDRHPTMSRHPVTPMHEADLRVHLAAQGLTGVGAVHYPAYGGNREALDALLDKELARLARDNDDAPQCVLFDIAEVPHLATVGRLVWEQATRQALLAVGASSVAQALTVHLAEKTPAPAFTAPNLAAAEGPVFVLSGSMSPVTARQIEAATGYERLSADAARLVEDCEYKDQLIGLVVADMLAGRNVLVYTHDAGAAKEVAPQHIAQAAADFVVDVVTRMAKTAPLRRIGVAGGDTSSRVAQTLGLWGLSYQTTMAPGVTLCRAHSERATVDGLELMLKGGQMGPTDVFDRLALGT